MTKKVALVTGITGQDGAYLAELLLGKGYTVHGIRRRNSLDNTSRIDHLFQNPGGGQQGRLHLHYGDMTDATNLIRIVKDTTPDEIYNLAAMSHVKVSFDTPEYTAETNALGTLRLLEGIRILGLASKTKFFQASTSELFGNTDEVPQNEQTPFKPRSPYGVAKLYGYWITVNYREAYGIFAANGIMFNHESPVRGETFATRKITRAVVRIALGSQEALSMGNLDARRDWGHATDYAKGIWSILQYHTPQDFVLATGVNTSIRKFITMAFAELGIGIEFRGEGLDEVGIVKYCNGNYLLPLGKEVVKVDPACFRPTEVETLVGDASKARDLLGWSPSGDLKALVKEMIAADLKVARGESKGEVELSE